MEEVMIGETPNSIRVPLFEANMALNQYSGSEVSAETIPYSGIWPKTKKINKDTPVHINFWL